VSHIETLTFRCYWKKESIEQFFTNLSQFLKQCTKLTNLQIRWNGHEELLDWSCLPEDTITRLTIMSNTQCKTLVPMISRIGNTLKYLSLQSCAWLGEDEYLPNVLNSCPNLHTLVVGDDMFGIRDIFQNYPSLNIIFAHQPEYMVQQPIDY
jgi:hypothetical protein